MAAVRGYMWAIEGRSGQILCAREFVNSLADSSFEEVRGAIESHDFLSDFYEIGDTYIRTKDRLIEFTFAGLRRNLDSIKSKANILLCWVDEAETVSETAWMKLIPTIREESSELWVTWNPESKLSATHKRFRESPPQGSKLVEINWKDNPFFPEGLDVLRRREQQRLDPATYAWIWEGAYRQNSDAQVFGGKIEVREFEPNPQATAWRGPFYGGDFGFSQDPTAAVEVWINDQDVYIRREAYRQGLELDDTASFVMGQIPGFEREVSRWDNSRPESISHLQRHGLPRAQSVKKWAGSVEDGIAFLRSFRSIVIHADCANMQRESRLYSYKVNDNGDVTSKVIDAHNHGWDAVRYALEPMIGGGSDQIFGVL